MGAEVVADRFDLTARQRFRARLRECLDALDRMLREERFEGPRDLIGLEMELCLADSDGAPRMVNKDLLARMATQDFQSELGKFTIELNMPPHRLSGRVFDDMAEELRVAVGYADRTGGEFGAQLVLTGVLPTIEPEQVGPGTLSPEGRYTLLNDQILALRGEAITLAISGAETLDRSFESIAPEAACTSVQFHTQVTPDRFAAVWNAAQAIAGPQIAVGANAPFVFGQELWHETRPMLFSQATDSRPPELAAQGVRPRTWFGERWITSAADLFEENVRYFPALLPVCSDEDPLAVLDSGGIPELTELCLHNGSVYRWNRPVYDIADGVPHLRVENRILSTGPTVTDTVANAAFFHGLVRALADDPDPVWTRLAFADAERNFDEACRNGVEALLTWPGEGNRPAYELIPERLLPLADQGLAAAGVAASDREHYLGIIGERCRRRVTGAGWQTAVYHRLVADGADRTSALRGLVRRYCELSRTDAPVHTWPTGD
ncbi:glutamate--cysteine ligase [Streptomyces sp. NPDC049879]|uniref:glutamate--cysteine ligase n=1 Tax=Streptomyces sp. NPDC049879 TaxID=3365598 RepID=UPI00378BF4CD